MNVLLYKEEFLLGIMKCVSWGEKIMGTVIFIELQNSFLTLKDPSIDSTPWLLDSNSMNDSPFVDCMTDFPSLLESLLSKVKKI